jgi:multiple sugar transport system permease protein
VLQCVARLVLALPAQVALFYWEKPVRIKRISARRIDWSAYLFILPAFVILVVFHIFPVFYAVYTSLNKGAINKFQFVGLDNYTRALGSSDFWQSLGTTFTYTLLTIPLTILLGLFFAYLLFNVTKQKGVYRSIYFLPYVISTVGSAVVWAVIFDPSSGFANQALGALGIPPLRWLVEPSGLFKVISGQTGGFAGPAVALVAVSIFTIWQSMGYDVIIFMAGLTGIPRELYEAARMDGAGGVALFRYITLPLLAPTTFFVIVISVIGSLQSFNQIYAMNTAAAQSLGGPLGSTNTLTVYMFNQLYSFSNYGYASAIAVLLSLIILGLTLLNFRFLGRRAGE